MTGAELFGNDVRMPRGVTYLKLAATTADDIWESWDAGTCNGGIFWTRNRNAATPALANYKSTITNAQYLSFAGRLYILTGDKKYLDRGIATWKWMNDIGIISSNGDVSDGADAPTCNPPHRGGYTESYIYGQLVEGLSYMYLATKDSSYLESADVLTRRMLSTYSSNNVIRDVNCEPNCPLNRVSPKGIVVRGLAVFYPIASDSTKELIRVYIDASFAGMLKTCNSEFACSNYWGPEGTVYSDFHHQLNVVGLFYAAQAIYAPPAKPFKFQYTSDWEIVSATLGTTSKTGATSVGNSESGLSFSFTNFAGIMLFLYSLTWMTA
jgi:mannan endo-1,6-alpha-mannosidase